MAPLRQHDYRNVDGSIFGRKEKYGPKWYKWFRYQDGKFIEKLESRAPIYHADQVAHNLTIILTEGERDADTLAEFGLCTSCGAHGATWDDEWADNFKGKNVIICPDTDTIGQEYARNAGRSLLQVAVSVQILDLPTEYNGRPIKDITDLYEVAGDEFPDAWQELLDAARPFADFHEPGTNGDSEEKKNALPQLIDAWDLCNSKSSEPPIIIDGILHRGCKMVLGGGSKSFKTWMLLELAIALAHGDKWMDRNVLQGNVVYLNFELPEFAIQARIDAICKAKGLPVPKGRLKLWNLRGHATRAGKLLPELGKQLADMDFCAALIDPLYKLRPGVEDNSAGHMTEVMNCLDQFSNQIRSSIIYGEHFAKGPAGLKDPIDRISGSGVQARDPDSIVLATKHKVPDCFIIEMILRCFAPVESFVVRRENPLMVIAPELDPDDIKVPAKPGETSGRPSHAEARFTKIELELIKSKGMTQGELQKATGIKESTLKRDLTAMEKAGRVFHSPIDHKYACRH